MAQPQTTMATYVVTFDRIGRNHDAPTLITNAHDGHELAEKIYEHAKPHLLSRAFMIEVDLDAGTGLILGAGSIIVGFHNAGRFKIARTEIDQ